MTFGDSLNRSVPQLRSPAAILMKQSFNEIRTNNKGPVELNKLLSVELITHMANGVVHHAVPIADVDIHIVAVRLDLIDQIGRNSLSAACHRQPERGPCGMAAIDFSADEVRFEALNVQT